jgi:dipeptidyl aminopeptidase/acylaminoacyl peptidase
MRPSLLISFLIVIFVVLSACTGNTAPPISTYTVSDDGVLTLHCTLVTVTEEVIVSNETYTQSRIVLHTECGDVTGYLSAPKSPKAAVVYVPGAGEQLAGHEERMVRFASAGYAFLFVDMRGNGGETAGIPFGQELIAQDYARFNAGEMPRYYLSICDLIAARKLLDERYHVPVYAIGSSNGGRYAAVAVGLDPAFAGYVGISTSDWGLLDSLAGQGYTGDPIRFAASIEPRTYIGRISPRPVWMFHAEEDPVIPYESGRLLFEHAGEPKAFSEFSGDHGINPDVDERIIRQWAQIYAPRK